MRHGYTNETAQVGSAVVKTYAGPHATHRRRAERRALEFLAERLPTPAVLDGDSGSLTVEFVQGRHGQELVDAGFASEVLSGCGEVLRLLHSLDAAALFEEVGVGEVIVHGDFGPNNVLFAEDGFAVAGVLDWEFCHRGSRVEDLAWCEWILRAHHPTAIAALPDLFTAYGWTPSWADRQVCMVRRCAELEEFCREWDPPGSGVATWIERGEQVVRWSE